MGMTVPESHTEGSAEPWIQDLLCSLLCALQRRQPHVVELGGFLGHTSVCLAAALHTQGGGRLTVVEWDAGAPERADAVQERLAALSYSDVEWQVIRDDVLVAIRSFPDESVDFAFVDDDHAKAHVAEEIRLLLPKMTAGGIITVHDVWGTTDLQEVLTMFGGYSLDLPRLGPAGGLGILQVR